MAEPTSMQLGVGIALAVSGTSARSAAIGTANSAQPGGYTICRLVSTVDVWFKIVADPNNDIVAVVATAPNSLLPANSPECFDVPFGYKIAAIAGGAGYLSITPLSKT